MRNKPIWHSVILLGLVLLLASSLSACGATPSSAPPSQPTPEQTTSTSPEEPKGSPPLDEPSPTPSLTPSQTPSLCELKVHFIDVGQGDSILIDYDETEILIDGGDKSSGIEKYLTSYVDGAIEVMIVTHPHADHIGGLIDVLAAFEVQEIWLNGDTSTSKTYSQFMSAVNSEGAQVCEARRGDTIEVGGLVFNALNPVNLSGTTNNNSIVLSLGYGEVDFLFTGDAEQEAEASMLADGLVPDVEI